MVLKREDVVNVKFFDSVDKKDFFEGMIFVD